MAGQSDSTPDTPINASVVQTGTTKESAVEKETAELVGGAPSRSAELSSNDRPVRVGLIDKAGHIANYIKSKVIPVEDPASSPSSSLSPTAATIESDSPPTWTSTIVSLFLPSHRQSLPGASPDDVSLSLREEDGAFARSHPDLWPFRASSARSHGISRPGPASHVNPGVDLIDDDDDDDEEDDEEISESDVAAVLEEFGPPDDEDLNEAASVEAPKQIVVDPAQAQAERAKAMKEEYDAKCGGFWTDYRACLQVSAR